MKKTKINKQIIIETAIMLADIKGYHNVTLKDIAENLEIKTPSLYNHLNGLEELYDLLAYEGLRQLLKTLTNSIIGLCGREALLSMGAAYRTFACNSPGLYSATQRVPVGENESNKELSKSIVDLIVKLILVYKFTDQQNIHIVRTIRSYLHGFALLERQDSFGLPISINDSFEIGLNCILDGLKLF